MALVGHCDDVANKCRPRASVEIVLVELRAVQKSAPPATYEGLQASWEVRARGDGTVCRAIVCIVVSDLAGGTEDERKSHTKNHGIFMGNTMRVSYPLLSVYQINRSHCSISPSQNRSNHGPSHDRRNVVHR